MIFLQSRLRRIRWFHLTIESSSICSVNSLAPGKFEWNFRYLIFQIISVIDGWGISCELALRWTSLNLTDDKSTLVLVMVWCHQATSLYLSQCWPNVVLFNPPKTFPYSFHKAAKHFGKLPKWELTKFVFKVLHTCQENHFNIHHQKLQTFCQYALRLQLSLNKIRYYC